MSKGNKQIQRQIHLPLSKAVEIAVRSMRARLTRSVLTLITIAMAVAFLTSLWSGSVAEPVIKAALQAKQGLAEVRGPGGGGVGESPQRTIWLIGLSLLVCMVGISNAMLMSVMERFREIGTMKCLGALDSFILKLFVIESLFLGAIGTSAGVLVGLVINWLMMMKRYGGAGAEFLPWGEMPLVAAGSLGIGIAITTGAALYPALKAARMEPIAAMRVDV